MAPGRRAGCRLGAVLRLGVLVVGAVLARRALRRWVEGPASLPTDDVWPAWEDD